MLSGERVYQDFFQFTPPGTDLVYAAAFGLLGQRVWVANATMVAAGVALAAVCYRVAAQFAARSLALLSAVMFIVLAYGKALNATHHWFSVLAIMGAVVVFSANSNHPRFLGAGALLGLGSFFTQSHGIVALFAFTIFAVCQAVRETRSLPILAQRILRLFGGYAFALLCLSGYFIVTAGPDRLWQLQIAYPWQHVPHQTLQSSLGLGIEEIPTWRRLPSVAPYLLVYAILPSVYAYVLAHCWRRRVEPTFKNWNCLTLTSFVGVLLLIEVATNPNWLRIFGVSLPAFALLAWVFDQAVARRRPFLASAWIATIGIGLNHIDSMHRHYALAIEAPAGKIVTDAVHGEQLQWLASRTLPGQFLFAADRPIDYMPLRLRAPLFLDVIDSGQTLPEYVERGISELEARGVQYVLWPSRLDAMKADSATARAIADLRTYIHERYRFDHLFSSGEQVWQRRAD